MDAIASRNLRPPLGPATRFIDPATFPEPARTLLMNSLARAKTALADEFKGISSDNGALESSLFPIAKTGVSAQSIVEAANAFLALLSNEQRQTVTFAIDAKEWRSWQNMHCFLLRHGLMLDDLTVTQREAVLNILRASLSAAGYDNARDVMKLNHHAAEITNRFDEFGEWFYWISLFGQPSESEPWGWQIDGHHLIVNCFVLGDQMVMTPDFRGSEPVAARSGKYAGTKVFQEEEALGLELMRTLTPEQQQTAIIGTTIPRDVITTAQVDNLELPATGICYDSLTSPQRELMRKLIALYVGRIRPGHDQIRMAEVIKRLSRTFFGWIGQWGEDDPFYYRIYSPVILIEFDHLPGIIWDNMEPTRDHIHTVVRTPNGNDYGRDLLRQHYAQHDHSNSHSPHRRGLA
jgi:hypothetical protein